MSENPTLKNESEPQKPRTELCNLEPNSPLKMYTPDSSWDIKYQGVKWYKDRGLNVVYTDINSDKRKALSMDQAMEYCREPLGGKIETTFKTLESSGKETTGWAVTETPQLGVDGSLEGKQFKLTKIETDEKGNMKISTKSVSATEFTARNNIAIQ